MAWSELAGYVTVVSFIFISIFYLSYLAILHCSLRRSGRPASSETVTDQGLPAVSMIVPTYNEEKIISKKISNTMQLNYPKDKLEVIFVDGCSTDGTVDAIVKCAGLTNIKLVVEDCRMGYNAAVLAGVSKTNVSSDGIVVATGADVCYDLNALRRLCRHFVDFRVGAVAGREILANRNESVGTKIEGMYRKLQDFLSEAEMTIDSPFDVKGEICAVRMGIAKSLLERRKELLRKGSFDCCISSETRKRGYKVVYDRESTYTEYAPVRLSDRMRMQTRRAKTLLESLLMYKDMILNRTYGAYGTLILPAHFIMLIVIPWLFLAGLASLTAMLYFDPNILLVLGASFSLLALRRIRLFTISFVQSQLSLVWAMLMIAMGRKTQIFNQIQSTRR